MCVCVYSDSNCRPIKSKPTGSDAYARQVSIAKETILLSPIALFAIICKTGLIYSTKFDYTQCKLNQRTRLIKSILKSPFVCQWRQKWISKRKRKCICGPVVRCDRFIPETIELTQLVHRLSGKRQHCRRSRRRHCDAVAQVFHQLWQTKLVRRWQCVRLAFKRRIRVHFGCIGCHRNDRRGGRRRWRRERRRRRSGTRLTICITSIGWSSAFFVRLIVCRCFVGFRFRFTWIFTVDVFVFVIRNFALQMGTHGSGIWFTSD